jgi:ribosomal-protein-alanine N-acetyltransferase
MDHRDLDEVMELERLCFPSPWSRRMFEQEMEHRWAVLEVARLTDEEGQVGQHPMAGYSDYWLVYDEVHLLNIAVHPKFRRRSIGRILVERVFEAARQIQCGQVILEVRPSNVEAMNLYDKLGFEVIGVRRGYYHDSGEDALVMAKRF